MRGMMPCIVCSGPHCTEKSIEGMKVNLCALHFSEKEVT